jgi:hypothetical protein
VEVIEKISIKVNIIIIRIRVINRERRIVVVDIRRGIRIILRRLCSFTRIITDFMSLVRIIVRRMSFI